MAPIESTDRAQAASIITEAIVGALQIKKSAGTCGIALRCNNVNSCFFDKTFDTARRAKQRSARTHSRT